MSKHNTLYICIFMYTAAVAQYCILYEGINFCENIWSMHCYYSLSLRGLISAWRAIKNLISSGTNIWRGRFSIITRRTFSFVIEIRERWSKPLFALVGASVDRGLLVCHARLAASRGYDDPRIALLLLLFSPFLEANYWKMIEMTRKWKSAIQSIV